MPTSSKEAMRPRDFMLPVVGAVTLDNIFNKVDLPAPFLPIIPNNFTTLYFKINILQCPYIITFTFVLRSFVSPIFK